MVARSVSCLLCLASGEDLALVVRRGGRGGAGRGGEGSELTRSNLPVLACGSHRVRLIDSCSTHNRSNQPLGFSRHVPFKLGAIYVCNDGPYWYVANTKLK